MKIQARLDENTQRQLEELCALMTKDRAQHLLEPPTTSEVIRLAIRSLHASTFDGKRGRR